MSALMPVILYILGFTLCVECLGAVAIYVTLPDDMFIDFEHRAAFSAFHSLSAFCNGGFTTLPGGLADPRLYNGNQMFYIVMTLLIIAGGIGFPNLVNFKDAFVEYFRRIKAKILHRQYSHREHVYDLNTKLVLIFTVILFVGGAIGFTFSSTTTLCTAFRLAKESYSRHSAQPLSVLQVSRFPGRPTG